MKLKPERTKTQGPNGLSETLLPSLVLVYLLGPLFLLLSLFFSVRDRLLDPLESRFTTSDEEIAKILAEID